MDVFFTVVVPTLNEEQCLPRILNDLCNQKEKNFEIVIIDGCSTDATKSIAEKYKSKIPLRFFENDKNHVSIQRNLGAQKAFGKYIIFLDADARVYRAFTKKLQSFICRYKGLVFIPAIAPDEHNSQTKVVFNFANLIIDLSQSIGRPFSSGGSMIFEKNFFTLIGGFPENVYMSEDHQIIQKAYKYGVRARFMRHVKVVMSLRRMKKQGELKLLYQYLLTAAQYLIKGKIDKKVIEYQMGGHIYLPNTPNQTFEEKIQEYLIEAKRFFKTIFK